MRKNEMDAVEIAQKQRHLYLLNKIKNNRHLSPKELEELKKLEDKAKPKKSSQKQKASGFGEGQVLKTQKQAAGYAKVNERTIRRWVKAGMPRAEDKSYIKAMLDFYKNNEGKEATEEKKAGLAADADYKDARAKLLQMELEVKQGELIPREQIQTERTARILAVKRGLLGAGRKLAPQLKGCRDEKKIARIINEEMRTIIRGFAGQ